MSKSKQVVIVESPTKAKTLQKYLGADYTVLSSKGHVRDLPKTKLGIDVEKDFEPQYQILPRQKQTLSALKKNISKDTTVFLATDLDREGEAIAWHLTQALHISPANQKRVIFDEITKSAIIASFQHPQKINQSLVDAQQGRRILDRLVGYKLSPLLWKKVRPGLSAGRVQSVAVRLIVQRERERQAFAPKEYWEILALLTNSQDQKSYQFEAKLVKIKNEKAEIANKQRADEILNDLKGQPFVVGKIEQKTRQRHPAPPFTTSTLQQEAVRKLSFSAKRTMRAAQNLYENGLITYMRTDSLNVAEGFIDNVRDYIKAQFGEKFIPQDKRRYKNKSKTAQEAHEAIRPTEVANAGDKVSLGNDEQKLYSLIWKRAVASQMESAQFEQIKANIAAGEYLFNGTGQRILFPGFIQVYLEGVDNGEEKLEKDLPKLTENEPLKVINITSSQHFTEPPARFTEATLIKTLEEKGIGRPSTYAPIMQTIQDRGYVGKDKQYFYPFDVGFVVNDFLTKHFPEIVDLDFTAGMENQLDEVAESKKPWKDIIKAFYGPFEKALQDKEKSVKKEEVVNLEKTDQKCPECQRPLVIKLGRYGKFYSCTGFPDCKYAKPHEGSNDQNNTGAQSNAQIDQSQLEGSCPKDGGKLILKQGRFGKFIACENYPKCKFTKNYLEKIDLKCPKCQQGEVILKRTRKGKVFFGCSRYPDCDYASWEKPKA